MIDIERLEELIQGKIDPESLGEEMFLDAYREAVTGILLFVYLMNIGETLDSMNLDDLHLMMLGYAMGQNDLETIELNLNNSKLH